MNVKKLFLMMAAVSGALALCQCSSEAPPPPGTVRMVDQQAIALMQEARAKEVKNDLSGAIKKYRRVVEKHPLSREAPRPGSEWQNSMRPARNLRMRLTSTRNSLTATRTAPCTGRPWPGRRKWPSALRAAR